ncbi:MAG: DsrE/DsrF/DrsH-like family protein [Actinobacteria bacterium]|nr:DsrE/DsrF/DrsH-like family protein [Actinomycetota bacterium]
MTEDATALLEAISEHTSEPEKADKLTIIAWSGELDRIWPTLILSTTARACGMEAAVFFTFWGLFPLVRPEKRLTGSDWMTRGLSLLNPGSPHRAKLSKYNFGGAGPWMLKRIAGKHKVPEPRELLTLSQDLGVRLLPCQMTMDLMGLGRDDLIDGLEEPVGAATALLEMKDSIHLFI